MNKKIHYAAVLWIMLIPVSVFAVMPDLNSDNAIDLADVSVLSAHWLEDNTPVSAGECGDENHPYPYGDINGDCLVDIQDAVILISQWLSDPYIPDGIETVSQIKDEQFNGPDHEWAQWVVTNFSPTRIHFEPWTDPERQQFLDEYVPDHIGEWAGPSMNRGDFCRMRGIAANTTHEYGSNEELNELRGHTLTVMHDNGLAIKENGTYANGGWDGTYLLCRNAPKWLELSKQSAARQAVYGESIFHDKFGTTLSWLDQGYCVWCNRKFKDYMQNRFTPRQLWDMGFDSATFDLSAHAASKRAVMSPSELLEEPIIHEYIRFQYISHLKTSVEIIDAYHEAAEKAGAPIPAFYGNQGMISGARPFPVVLSDHVDIVWSEQSHCYQRPLDPDIQAFSTLLWKTGRAAGHYEKAVWSVQYQAGSPDERPFGFGADKKYPTALALAEAAANGGVMCQTWTATAYNEQNVTETLLEGHRYHANFVSQNRGLFIDRTSVAETALVYSVPSMFWRYCYKLTLSDFPHLNHFGAAGRFLEDEQIPYNVVLFGHKDVYDDTQDLASLSQYQTLILPYADCISDQQAQAVSDWTRAGGKLVLWASENVGTRNEELAPRPSPVFTDLIGDPGSGSVEIISTSEAESYRNTGSGGLLIFKIANPSRLVVSGLPSTVWLNLWRHGAGPMMSVQMFNNDLDVETDTITPVQNFNVRVRVPSGVNYTQAWYINADYAGAVPQSFTSVPFTISGDYLVADISRLDLFGILVFCTDDELDARMLAGQVRKGYERLKIALRSRVGGLPDYSALLGESETLLGQIQGDVPVADFSALLPPLQTKNSELQAALNSVTSFVQAAQNADTNTAVNVDAYQKFDFGQSGAPSGWIQVTPTYAYSSIFGYGWDSRSFTSSKLSLSEDFSGVPDHIFPDNLSLDAWEFENYDTQWGTDLSHAAFNGAGQLLLTADIDEACQGLKYYIPDTIIDWETEWTLKPIGPAGAGFWGINIINGASTYGRFQVYFGRDGAYQLIAKGGTSGWTNVASVDLQSMPETLTIRLAWNDAANKISVYYGLNGAPATTALVLDYSQNEPVGSTLINLRNFEWDFGTYGTPGNHIYELLVDDWTFEGDLEGITSAESFSGQPSQTFPDDLDLNDWVFENFDTNWGTDLKNASFNGAGQLKLTANRSEACQGLKYNASADLTDWQTEWSVKLLGPAGDGFWGLNIVNGASSFGRVQVYFGKNGGNQLQVLGGTSGWTPVAEQNFILAVDSVKIKCIWNDSTNRINIYYGLNGAAAVTPLLQNYPQNEPDGSTLIGFRNYEWDFGMTGTPGYHTYETLLDEWTFNGDIQPTAGTAVNHEYPDALHRDFIRSKDPQDYATGYPGNNHFPYPEPPTGPGYFNVDLPNGDYIVTVLSGDYQEFRTDSGGPANEGRTSMTRVHAEGLPVLFGNRCQSGYFQNNTFPVTVADGQLNLAFSGQAVGPLYCNPIEWLVNGLVIQMPGQALTPLAQASLDRHDLLSRCAIRHWNILGSFDDDDCLGLETKYGPETSDDLAQVYQGKSGQITWQSVPELAGFAPYLDFTDYINSTDEVAGFAMCFVYCPDETQALLVCGMSQSGEVYLNGVRVVKDELAVGLIAEEQTASLTLNEGWNTLLFKSLNHWGQEWKLFAGLLTAAGDAPLTDQPGIVISLEKTDN